jgi:predicted phage terminase large subunit-like protein
MDGKQVRILIPQEPGQAGVDQVQNIAKNLEGFNFSFHPVAKHASRIVRAEPVAAQWQVGNVEVVKGFWNKEFFDEMEGFPSTDMHDDIVDATIDGINFLIKSGNVYAASKSKRGMP